MTCEVMNIKKLLAVGIILLLFTGMTLTSAITADKPTFSKTIYVDDDNVDGPWDGSQEHPYQYIQDAVDNASNWDTVFVYNGIYSDFSPDNYACVKITKSINLIGEDKHNTIINGTKHIIRVTSNNVTVSNFTLRSTEKKDTNGWGFDLQGHNDIIIKNKYYGFLIFVGKNIHIYNNQIINNWKGIEIQKNSFINVDNNLISNNGIGIEKVGNSCTFEKNYIHNNRIGITITYGNKNNISNNEFRNNEIGLEACDDSESSISYNNFINNSKHATINKRGTIFESVFYITSKNKWFRNYWHNWFHLIPRPIIGIWVITLRLFPSPMTIPIAIFPYIETDWHPAQEPYDIPAGGA